jgi:TctA family transporter
MKNFLSLIVLLFIFSPIWAGVPKNQTDRIITKDAFHHQLKQNQPNSKPNFLQRILLNVIKRKIEKKYGKSPKSATSRRKLEPLSILSVLSGGLGILFLSINTVVALNFLSLLGFVFGIGALVLGTIGISRIKRQKERFKGKLLGIVGVLIGGFFAVALIFMTLASIFFVGEPI